MTTVAATVGAPGDDVVEPRRGVRVALSDSITEARRHLTAMPRNPDQIVFAVLQPIMFIVLFYYVFGGSIEVPGMSYVQYLLPGIFAQTVVFGSIYTSIGLAEDMQKGFVDRLRSLPISRAAVLIGRTLSDLVRNVLSFTVMLGVAFAIGFRFEGGLPKAMLATLLLLAFSYSFSWIQALIGLSVKSVEAANSAGFLWMFPMTFVSSAFVSTSAMTPWLQRIADANPFTIATNAARALYNGLDPDGAVWQSIAWAIGLTVVFAVLSIRRFARVSHQ
jgi:ABC-2 type transport system permease protein/oleandomycin transport system permease protein